VAGDKLCGDSPSGAGCVGVVPVTPDVWPDFPGPTSAGVGGPVAAGGGSRAIDQEEPTVPPVNYTPDWSLFAAAGGLATKGLNLLAAIALAACAGFFVWGAILTAGGVSSQVPHNVARGRQQMLVSALCALAIGIGALLIRTFFEAGRAAG
jgi:hypothetical protein